MRNLHIDIETYSAVELSKCGVYRYAEDPSFEILLFGYSADGAPVRVVDLACGEKLPREVMAALIDDNVIKWAFNAQFERVCLSRYYGVNFSPASWRCTMAWAATLGLPLSLENVGAVLGLDKQKLKEGKELIRYFSKPCAPTKANGGRIRNRAEDAPDKWSLYKAYNKRDVETEMAIQTRLAKYPVPESEWNYYTLDQQINDRGVMLDMHFVDNAIACDRHFRETHMAKAKILTGLENPNSAQQLKGWLEENGVAAESLSKAAVGEMLSDAEGTAKEVLMLRQQLAKSSVKKYAAMEQAVCKDGRAHGLLQYYGANRTGRWAGRLIQVQNLPQNHLPDLAEARAMVRDGRFGEIEARHDSVPTVLSELIRTAFIPKPGCKFYVADFSAIEARVIAWLAGESWRMAVFATHGKIYEASASQMFHVPIEEITKGSLLRQKGKIAELALGYGGSVGALTAMGALSMGVPENELPSLVRAWRASNTNIIRLWWAVDEAAAKAVRDQSETQTHGIHFIYQSGILFVQLPSGRRLAYDRPRIEKNRFDRDAVTYEGVGENKKWQRVETYGPKLVENIVQATSRDILAEAMRRLNAAGYQIVMHVHDEVVIEAPTITSLQSICEIMAKSPNWAESLPLRADGYVCDFYKKD